MPNPSKPHQPSDQSSLGSVAWAAGAGLLMVACCAAPALIASSVAASALGALGVWVNTPWVIGLAVLVLLIVAGGISRRITRHRVSGSDGAGEHDCCGPNSSELPAHHADRNARPD